MVSGQQAQVYCSGEPYVQPAVNTGLALLLRNVNLFLFVYVAEKVYQTTNKGDCSQAERDPSVGVTAGGIRIGHKSIEIIDRTDGGCHAYQYRENIFQAFHFEPPANRMKL